jgi:hypothetical protein
MYGKNSKFRLMICARKLIDRGGRLSALMFFEDFVPESDESSNFLDAFVESSGSDLIQSTQRRGENK